MPSNAQQSGNTTHYSVYQIERTKFKLKIQIKHYYMFRLNIGKFKMKVQFEHGLFLNIQLNNQFKLLVFNLNDQCSVLNSQIEL